ncbi:hypothetical protein EV673_1737 [Limnobacter thiooxidans]|uniref:hypothetical protein n=1 Tax=Limnobacter TaxID=131079 RepID=UPI00102D767A|nr:hypothetical protein [Limnobacter sp.]MCZ8016197.1 hypothetical protein [Limnobacter sp.]RZS39980.1 hypothetical protein EV673_1737 [Limnobacter thiooxidans]
MIKASFWVVWLVLMVLHAAVAVVPFYAHESMWTALLAYYSYFGLAVQLYGWGLPAIGEFREGMLIAPVTPLGQCLIVLFWMLTHAMLAALFSCSRFVRRRLQLA